MVQRPGQLQPDPVLGQRSGPGFHVIARVDRQVVMAGPRGHAVELHKVDAPGGDQIGDRMNVFLRPRLGEIDLVIDVPIVRLPERLGGDVLHMVFRSVNRQVKPVSFLGQTRYQVDPDLLPVVMNIIHQILKTVRI
ncbi:hypothetical protein D3C76_786290 [compost metagenome]